MFRRLAAAFLLRRVVRALERLAESHARQEALLQKLCNRYAPAPLDQSPTDRATIKADTGVSYLDAADAALAGDFIERQRAATGHTPDDEELLIYLADEKTRDLHERLVARDDELTRLAESRS